MMRGRSGLRTASVGVLVLAVSCIAEGRSDGREAEILPEEVAIGRATAPPGDANPAQVPQPQSPADRALIQRRDSADVEIIEIDPAVFDQLPRWHIDSEPLVEIGVLDGAPPYVFAGIDPERIAVLANGDIAVVDGSGVRGSREVRVFDTLGVHVMSVGKAGQGPGEFQFEPLIRATSTGGIVTLEDRHWRITRFDALGEVAGTRQWNPLNCTNIQEGRQSGPTCGTLKGLLANGNILFEFSGRPAMGTLRRAHIRPGEVREISYVAGIGTASTYLPFRYISARPMRIYESYNSGGEVTFQARHPILTARPAVAAGNEHIVVSRRDSYEFEIRDDDGALQRMVRVRMEPTVLTRSQQAKVLEGTAPNLAVAGVTDTLPFLGTPRFGEGDDIWVPDFRDDRVHGDDAPYLYTIFDVSGEPIARLQVEPDQIFLEGGRRDLPFDAISGRERYRVAVQDELGVPRVRIFRIIKEE